MIEIGALNATATADIAAVTRKGIVTVSAMTGTVTATATVDTTMGRTRAGIVARRTRTRGMTGVTVGVHLLQGATAEDGTLQNAAGEVIPLAHLEEVVRLGHPQGTTPPLLRMAIAGGERP